MGHNLFRYGVVAFAALAAIVGGRDLRPSDHGLAFQEHAIPPSSPNGGVKGMRSFFGAAATVQLPEAKNISDTWVSAHAEGGGGARDVGERDHVRVGLLAASAVCGLTGVVLLAVSGVVFVYRLQKRRRKTEGVTATSAFTSLPQSLGNATNKIITGY